MTTLTFRDGSTMLISDIDTVAAGEAALDELDRAIINIEEHVERGNRDRGTDQDWLIRAKTALKHRRRSRPILQERIAQLRRAEKDAARQAHDAKDADQRKTWLDAFMKATRDELPGERFMSLCRRADEIVAMRGERDMKRRTDRFGCCRLPERRS